MAKLTLEGSEAFPVLPEDSIIPVRVLSVSEKTATTRAGETWQKLEFEFEITGVPDALKSTHDSLIGSRIWGSTSMRFSMHPDNKLRQWAEALLAGLELDEGFELDTDSLEGRSARALITNYVKKNGSTAHQVSSLLPLVPNARPQFAHSTVSAVADDEPPF